MTETTLTTTEQVMTALLAKGYVRTEPYQRFTVYVRHTDHTVVGLETFADGGCILWGMLHPPASGAARPREDAASLIAAIPYPPPGPAARWLVFPNVYLGRRRAIYVSFHGPEGHSHNV